MNSWLSWPSCAPAQVLSATAPSMDGCQDQEEWGARVCAGAAHAQLNVEALGEARFGSEAAQLLWQPIGVDNGSVSLDPFLVGVFQCLCIPRMRHQPDGTCLESLGSTPRCWSFNLAARSVPVLMTAKWIAPGSWGIMAYCGVSFKCWMIDSQFSSNTWLPTRL